jgi:uncharacterized damage-inducible protein DinB
MSLCISFNTGLIAATLLALSASAAQQSAQPTAAQLSAKETVGAALMRTFEFQIYEFRSAAEAMPDEKWDYRAAPGQFKNEKPEFGPAEVRTFRSQVKHVACANFAFAAELDGKTPPPNCDKDEPPAIKTRAEILTYLRDSFRAVRKSIEAINDKNKFDPIEGPYAGPNTRLGLAVTAIWHVADHYGQCVIYLRENGIVPPASRPNPPELKD